MLSSNLAQHYKGYEVFVSKLDEAVTRFERTGCEIEFDFLSPDEIAVACSFLGNQVPYQLIGGYENAISKKLVIGEVEYPEQYVACLGAKFNAKFLNISHRDVLGALYGLQIERCKCGDFWVEDGQVYLYVNRELVDFISREFQSAGKAKLHFQECEFQSQNFHFETRKVTVSSLRLDKVVSQIIKKSREKAKNYIESSMVTVNYKTIEDCDFLCHNNDILSLRGVGRFIIGETVAETKSGNLIIEVKRFV